MKNKQASVKTSPGQLPIAIPVMEWSSVSSPIRIRHQPGALPLPLAASAVAWPAVKSTAAAPACA